MRERLSSDSAFAAKTHIISSFAIFALLLSYFPNLIYRLIGTTELMSIITASMVVAAASLMPDLDNTQSKAMNTTGIIGKLLSKAMRGSAVVVYNLTKTSKDDQNANPHRGFWHSLFGALTIWGITFSLTSITTQVTLRGEKYAIGALFALIVILFSSYMLFETATDLFLGGKTSSFVSAILALGFASVVFIVIPDLTRNFSWIANCLGIGWVAHILGDMMTTQGVPLLSPIFKRKGKRWWYYRLTNVKSGGDIENLILLPLFSGLFIFSIIRMFF